MSLARLMDANANRAREAMRVMEDVARFILDDAELTSELKAARHEFRVVLDGLPPGWLEASRDTPGDVGTAITEPAESVRRDAFDLAVAAGKRLGESLRVLEEAAKTIDESTAARLESLRYRAYEIETRLHRRLGAGRSRQWRLCVLLSEDLCRRPWDDTLAAIIEAGVDCIQVREKSMPTGELAERARRVVVAARPSGVAVIVNDRPDVALAVEADGVHLGQEDMAVRDVRRLAGRRLLIGVSTHDLREARAAVDAGADYCGVGAMFATSLKPRRAPSGPAYLREFVARYPRVPHLAIGGITPERLETLIDAGARGLAVSSVVCAADDPGAVVRRLVGAMTGISQQPVS